MLRALCACSHTRPYLHLPHARVHSRRRHRYHPACCQLTRAAPCPRVHWARARRSVALPAPAAQCGLAAPSYAAPIGADACAAAPQRPGTRRLQWVVCSNRGSGVTDCCDSRGTCHQVAQGTPSTIAHPKQRGAAVRGAAVGAQSPPPPCPHRAASSKGAASARTRIAAGFRTLLLVRHQWQHVLLAERLAGSCLPAAMDARQQLTYASVAGRQVRRLVLPAPAAAP